MNSSKSWGQLTSHIAAWAFSPPEIADALEYIFKVMARHIDNQYKEGHVIISPPILENDSRLHASFDVLQRSLEKQSITVSGDISSSSVEDPES